MKLEGNKGDTRRHWSRKSSVDIIKHIVYSIKFSKNRLLERKSRDTELRWNGAKKS